MLNYIDTEGVSVTLVVEGKAHTILASNPNYNPLMDALLDEDWEEAKKLADLVTTVKSYVSKVTKDVEIRNEKLFYKGEELHGAVVNKILRFIGEGKAAGPLVAFMERLMANPSYNSRQRLYDFLAHNEVPITARGTFLAYKAVESDYLSKTSGRNGFPIQVSKDNGKTWEGFTGKVPNNIGNIVKVDRGNVDDNAQSECSYGLHAGGLDYVNWFGKDHLGDKKIIVEIDPANVVSVPADHNFGKLRTCEYMVLCDFKGEFKEALVDAVKPY